MYTVIISELLPAYISDVPIEKLLPIPIPILGINRAPIPIPILEINGVPILILEEY